VTTDPSLAAIREATQQTVARWRESRAYADLAIYGTLAAPAWDMAAEPIANQNLIAASEEVVFGVVRDILPTFASAHQNEPARARRIIEWMIEEVVIGLPMLARAVATASLIDIVWRGLENRAK
jgi:hypothetical protein